MICFFFFPIFFWSCGSLLYKPIHTYIFACASARHKKRCTRETVVKNIFLNPNDVVHPLSSDHAGPWHSGARSSGAPFHCAPSLPLTFRAQFWCPRCRPIYFAETLCFFLLLLRCFFFCLPLVAFKFYLYILLLSANLLKICDSSGCVIAPAGAKFLDVQDVLSWKDSGKFIVYNYFPFLLAQYLHLPST